MLWYYEKNQVNDRIMYLEEVKLTCVPGCSLVNYFKLQTIAFAVIHIKSTKNLFYSVFFESSQETEKCLQFFPLFLTVDFSP